MKRAMLFLATSIAMVACKGQDVPTETKAETPAALGPEAKNVTTTAAAVTIADTDLLTPADFEETAEKAITKANYKSELASLETDIAKE